jgi:hypothetical protein
MVEHAVVVAVLARIQPAVAVGVFLVGVEQQVAGVGARIGGEGRVAAL